jgi:hypothetical protein
VPDKIVRFDRELTAEQVEEYKQSFLAAVESGGHPVVLHDAPLISEDEHRADEPACPRAPVPGTLEHLERAGNTTPAASASPSSRPSSPPSRRRPPVAKQLQLAPCGTDAAYHRHRANGENADPACRAAHAAANRPANRACERALEHLAREHAARFLELLDHYRQEAARG